MTARKPLPVDLIDALLADYKKPEDLIGEEGLLKQLTKALVERALNAEMSDYFGHSKHAPVANPAGNTRNGKSRKTLKGDFGEFPIEVPRDRLGTFEPQLIGKHQTRWTGFDDKTDHQGVRCAATSITGVEFRFHRVLWPRFGEAYDMTGRNVASMILIEMKSEDGEKFLERRIAAGGIVVSEFGTNYY
jgi:hypothetical protein